MYATWSLPLINSRKCDIDRHELTGRGSRGNGAEVKVYSGPRNEVSHYPRIRKINAW